MNEAIPIAVATMRALSKAVHCGDTNLDIPEPLEKRMARRFPDATTDTIKAAARMVRREVELYLDQHRAMFQRTNDGRRCWERQKQERRVQATIDANVRKKEKGS
jgi:hypothetical protein